MNRRSKAAVKLYKRYIQQLDQIQTEEQAKNWHVLVYDSLSLHIGKEAELTKRLTKMHFLDVSKVHSGQFSYLTDEPIMENSYRFNIEHKHKFKDLLGNVIQYIEANGIKEDYVKTNFLSSLSTWQIWGGLLTALTVVVIPVTVYFTNLSNERKVEKAEKERDEANAKFLQSQQFVEMQKVIATDLENAVQERELQNRLLQLKLDSVTTLIHKPR